MPYHVGEDPLDDLMVDEQLVNEVMDGFSGGGQAQALLGQGQGGLSGEDIALLGALFDDDDDDDDDYDDDDLADMLGGMGYDMSDVMGASWLSRLKSIAKKVALPHTMLPKSVQAFVAPHTLITSALKKKSRRKRSRSRRRGQQRQAVQQALVSRGTMAGPRPVVAVPSFPSKGRYWPLGFDSVVTIAAGASAVIESSPQVEFRPERLVVPDSIAGSFLIQDLKVGKNSQFISNDPIPAEAFQTDATNVVLRMDSAKISQIISITVNNISGAAARFFASLMGPAIE